jgi:hypothetical protein
MLLLSNTPSYSGPRDRLSCEKVRGFPHQEVRKFQDNGPTTHASDPPQFSAHHTWPPPPRVLNGPFQGWRYLLLSCLISVHSAPQRKQMRNYSFIYKPDIFARGLLCLLSASCWFLAWFTFQPWRWWHISPKRRLTFEGLHGIIFHTIKLSTSTAARTSSPISPCMKYCLKVNQYKHGGGAKLRR